MYMYVTFVYMYTSVNTQCLGVTMEINACDDVMLKAEIEIVTNSKRGEFSMDETPPEFLVYQEMK